MQHRTIIFAIALTCNFCLCGTSTAGDKLDNTLFTQVLQAHVKDGVVNYRGIKADKRFTLYMDMLKDVDTASINQRERLPFWINMYNAWTIKLVVDNYPLKSITDLGADLVLGAIFKTTVWDKKLVKIRGGTMSLNAIEHDIIRKYCDARIHFAIVCASKSCPPLRNEAFEAERLHEQLDDQARIFLSDSTRNILNPEAKHLQLSKLFSWFEGDFRKDCFFAKENGSVIKFIARYVPKATAEKLRASEEEITIEYLDYDWSLNE
jgi:hypothetical protein